MLTIGTQCHILLIMQDTIYEFDPAKNAKLISIRGISFEEIIAALATDKLLDVVHHPNSDKYPHQKMYVIEHNGYAYLVPFVENNNKIFLKTAFPNREATKFYLSTRGD